MSKESEVARKNAEWKKMMDRIQEEQERLAKKKRWFK